MPTPGSATATGGAGGADFEVAIVGGALAGSAAAWLLLRDHPGLRVAVIERAAVHGRKVGEATVEVSAYFLTRVLGLSSYLQNEHLPKQGLRFWFANPETRDLAECSEIGGRYLVRVPSFQLDRAKLDEEVLRRAAEAGATLLRPATVERVELQPGGSQRLMVVENGARRTLTARWVIDASGVATLLARQEGWRRPNEAHPTASAWARWRGVADWDGLDLARKYPAWAAAHHGLRGPATNHLMGPGWWAWFIPLRGGDTSVGVVFDQRWVDWPEHGSVATRLKDFLCRHPAGRELLEHAQPVEDDVHWRRGLSYRSEVLAGDGFVLVSDAAGFLDPFYSPGMDWLTFTVTRAVDLVRRALKGESAPELARRYQTDFTNSYHRWFEGIYRDKYAYLGDFELMNVAFRLDLGCYYLGVASQPYRRGEVALLEPVFITPPSIPVYHVVRTYNRRLATMARSRRARGTFGRANHGRRALIPGFMFSAGSGFAVAKAVARWLALELREGWRTWFTDPPPLPVARPSSSSSPSLGGQRPPPNPAEDNAHRTSVVRISAP